MATIKPFRAIRPDAQVAEKVSTLPYDVFSEKEARDITEKNPESFLKIVRPETMFPENVNMYDNVVYEKARDALEENIRKGILVEEEEETYYVYRQTMNGRSQTGLVACFSVDDYLNDVIKKHEFTRPDKEGDRTRHIDICNAQTGLIFLAFNGALEVINILAETALRETLYDFVSGDGVRQQVWKIDEKYKVKAITDYIKKLDYLYIADGHHRCASAASICQKRRVQHPDYTGSEEFNYFLAVAFPQEELLIYPYNRVVTDLNGLNEEQFLKAVEDAGFEVSEVSEEFKEEEKRNGAYKPRRKGEIAMLLKDKWFSLTVKSEIIKNDAIGSLDVTLLQDNILDKILGIKDPRTDKRIDFIGGIRGFKELEKRCREDSEVAFALFPTSMQELMRVASEGKVMPPKSTWFEPKLQSGLFVHRI